MRSRGGSSDDGYWSNRSSPKTHRPHRHLRTAAATTQSLPEEYNLSTSYSVSSSSSSQGSVNNEEETQDEDEAYSTNERLLGIAFISFMSFSLTQMYFAFRAESEAMKGDSAAMIVDSLTYLFNWFAERRKRTFDQYYVEPTALAFTPDRAHLVKQRTKRKVILQYEILPPLLSVSTLVVVTSVVLREALRVIWLDLHRDPTMQSDPNIQLMMMFSCINLGLDGVNFLCFARGGHLFGYDTTEEERAQQAAAQRTNGQQPQSVPLNDNSNTHEEEEEDEPEFMNTGHHHHHHHQHANLNMCSAYTHVFADTLRSVAVIIAAAMSEIFDDVTAEEADAAAALVVSLLIILSLLPLFQGMVQSVAALWAIRAEERSEAMTMEIKIEEKRRRDQFWNEGKVEWS
uniref:Cation efflux protein transmembrane domain-containing protein n=1 Tax=Amphora coffeiformis TaxID=265554 RepID=A0A6S8JSI1_9STRA|mmetsp:Transcript_11485/g.21980  ORF Transcript_11485/g.21980 Transcript_11485/m.21980 type:complete len:401 (-) Transcript_11485:214-1416(-)